MSDREPVDAVAPWTIKSVSVATREAVTKAARREGLTVGQWLERRVAEWEADGSPVPAAVPTAMVDGFAGVPAVDFAGLAQLAQAALAAAAASKQDVPPAFARQVMAAARHGMKQARGPSPGRLQSKPAAIEG